MMVTVNKAGLLIQHSQACSGNMELDHIISGNTETTGTHIVSSIIIF